MSDKPKIFISAYACEPGLGSEIGVGWHWVLEMSRHFELWVLTRESNRSSIEPWIADHPEFAGIRFLYFDLTRWARFWKRGLRGVRAYYNLWQRFSSRIVKRTMRENGIDIFHHLTYGNVMWPVSGYGSKQTFIWGPVGGLETIPADYSDHYSIKLRLVESLRRSAAWYTRHSLGFRRRCRRADLILCKTEITRSRIPERYRDKAILFTDVAPECGSANVLPDRIPDGQTRFVAVGRLDAWRGFDLAIEALALAGGQNMSLTIVGKGADRQRLERLAQSLGLSERVLFAGKVDMERYKELMLECDVVVNPALKEGAVTVSFDAMAMGKPLLAVDTTGYTRYFTPDCSIVVPRVSRQETVAALAQGMIRLSDPALRAEMGAKALQASKEYSWSAHGLEIRDTIMNLINKP